MSNIFVLLLMLASLALAKQTTSVMLPGLDGKARALGIFVPSGYNGKKAAPLFVWLHGGTNRPEPDRGAGAVSFFADQAEKAGILCAAPSAQRGATWFDPVGFAAILNAVQYMKSHYAVDNNRIFVAGSSDGATACYLLAQRAPPQLNAAGFVVCSGYPYLLDRLGVNFDPKACARFRWFIVHSGKDHLYPLVDVRKAVAALRAAGGPVVFHQYPDLPHGLDYAQTEKPLILKWILKTTCPLPP